MEFLKLRSERWSEFFDGMSGLMSRALVEVEVAGLDLGDQIEADWLPMHGITYEPGDDTLYVYMDRVSTTSEADADHAIVHPREVFVELGEAGLNQLVVIDAEGHKQFLRLRMPLELPAATRSP